MESKSFSKFVASHLDKIIDNGTVTFGPDPNAMWLASLDTTTGHYPANDTRPEHIGQRVYRQIDAPRGSTIYWDQPQLAAAYTLSDLNNNARYAAAADAYVDAFLARSVAHTDLFLWGNHYYYDAFCGQVVWFLGDHTPSVPVDMTSETGHRHEMRPIPPAWSIFWQRNPVATERAIRAIADLHLVNAATGHFNRHADQKADFDFIESGGILVETLGWLYAQTGDASLRELALRIAQFSYSSCHPATGLIEVASDSKRWDKITSTTEVGLWAGSLLRAQKYIDDHSLIRMASEAVRAYLRHGYDPNCQRYYGRLVVEDGTPQLGPKETPYQPATYSDIWNVMFPTHDYPLALATSCVELFDLTKRKEFDEAVQRWAMIIAEDQGTDHIRYAESYGRAIYFLLRAADVFGCDEYHMLAATLAQRAITDLFAHDMFRGHTGEDRYDAVDGVGFLLLALLYMETGQVPDGKGVGF